MIKRITLTIIILLLLPSPTHAREGIEQVNNPHDLPPPTAAAEEPTPEPAPPPVDTLPILNAPWTAGTNDSGYCPLVYGYGWDGSLRWPVSGWSSLRPFGYYPGGSHVGVDLSVPAGTSVHAPAGGLIVWSGGNSLGYGNDETGMVAIASSGRVIILAHLSGIADGLDCGVYVPKGRIIGWSGGPGFGAVSPGFYHVHFEIRYNGLSWNPGLWLN